MKTLIAVLLFSSWAAMGADFTASTFFQTPISEQGEVKPAGGVNLRAIVWRGFGADVDLIQSATEDTFVDRTAAHIVYRHDLTDSLSAIGFAGPAYDFEDDEQGVEAGLGLEYSFVEGFVIYSNVRWQKDHSDQSAIAPAVGVGWKF